MTSIYHLDPFLEHYSGHPREEKQRATQRDGKVDHPVIPEEHMTDLQNNSRQWRSLTVASHQRWHRKDWINPLVYFQARGPEHPITLDFDFDFDDTRFRSFQSQDHVQVLNTETDWPQWSGDGANQIIIVTKLKLASVVWGWCQHQDELRFVWV